MVVMEKIRPDLEKITRLIKTTLDLEAAIFDAQSHLLAATDDYRRYKGETVHAPSIDEVVAHGNVTVNRPGHMAACKGCRFIGNCPAKIEILQRIQTGDKPLGAMALTTFSREGQNKIIQNTPTYVEALGHFTSWIGNLAADLAAPPAKPVPPPPVLLGESPPMKALGATIQKLSQSDSTILLTGETGTGKGLVAKVIHATGKRAKGPFVPVNCASIPDTLFESELFGYEEGAFTGAKKGGKPGKFELAKEGTLFLDEIGEMPLAMQVKLLDVLQDFSLHRVGGISPVPIEVRIIAATNQDLYQLMAEKKFRADLFYRLNVIPLELPPLAHRRGDIPLLATAFLKEFNPRAGKKIQDISAPVMERLLAHPWPGNIRELQNIMEYSINMEEGPAITLSSLPAHFLGARPLAHTDMKTDIRTDIKSRVLSTEKATILACLDRHGHHMEGKKKTAEELGISLRTLYRKLAAGGE